MSTRYGPRSLRIRVVFAGVLCLFIHFLFSLQNTFGQQTETLYGPEEGLPFNSITGITKDDNGFIWVAGVYGVCRFDGYSFKEYEYELNGTPRKLSYYPRFMRDRKNRIWVSHNGPTLLLYNRGRDRLDALDETRTLGYWCQLMDDGKGVYLVSDQGFITQLSETGDGSFSVREYEMPEASGQIVYMHRYEDGTLIVSSQNGIFRMVPGQDSLEVRKIRIAGPGATSEPAINFQTRFLVVGETVYLHKQYEILKTDLPVNGSFTDSVIYTEPVKLEFPDINLHQGERIYAAIPGEKDEIFLRTTNGIYRYNLLLKTAELIKDEFYGTMDAMEGIFQEALYYDPDGILWAGTDRGLLKIVFGKKAFHTLLPDPDDPEALRVGKLNQVLVDHTGHLWIGTMSDGLYRARADEDGDFRIIDHFMPDPDDQTSIHSYSVGYLFEDSRNRLWVRSENLQWLDLDGDYSVFHYSPASFYTEQLGTRVLPVNMIEDPEGNLIVSVRGSIPNWLITASGEEAYALVYDSSGLIMGGPYFCKTRDNRFYFYDRSCLYEMEPRWILNNAEDNPTPEDILSWGPYSNNPQIPWAYPARLDTLLYLDTLKANLTETFVITGPSGNEVAWLDLYYDARKIISVDLGKLEKTRGAPAGNVLSGIRLFSDEKGIDDTFLYEMVESRNGQLWGSTRDGLLLIDPFTDNYFKFYVDDGLPANKFYWGANVGEDGMVYMCTTNGLVYFNPDSVSPDPPPRLVFTDLEYFHRIMQPNPESFLKESIISSGDLTLNHNQNFIGIRFSTLEHRNISRIKYRYRLEGLDRDWITADNRRLAEYSNLKPGKYIFRLIAANGNGVWNMEGISLDIRVLQPIWFRWWAIVFEVMMLFSLLILVIRFRERNLKHQAVLLEQQVNEKTHEILEQRKEVDELKSRFYTNISHEFRTPLSLLISPIEDALKQDQEKIVISRRILNIMDRNARRLQNLINQLLDISRIESGKMVLHLRKANLSDFVRSIASSFYSLAKSRRIRYQITIEPDNEGSCFDADKTEKILMNLLSNAFKFCKERGTVSLELAFSEPGQKRNRKAMITVKDTGKGMEQDKLEKIFDRFYQVSESDTREVEGSGIGLSLAKELLEMMHGSIEVESTPGEGTTFLITFPVSEGSFSKQEIETMIPLVSSDETMTVEKIEQPVSFDNEAGALEEELILIVEDNPDLRSYINEKFSRHYKIIEAENGDKGLRKAIEEVPDLVITDLMMPVMGGVEFCRRLKEHPAISHIPVIMLTAKADKDSRIEGLEAAADDYIIKPFDSELLLARVRNLISQRNELRKYFEKEVLLPGNNQNVSNPLFKNLREVVRLMEAHLDDPDFELDSMASLLHMSRRGVFRKIKAITGVTPHELLRIMRMKRAAALLRRGNLNVTQVMYQVGMKNLSHFASSFRKYFGVNPSEYRSQEIG